MKVQLTTILLFTAASLSQAQTVTSGLIPKTSTFYVNTNYYNNGGGESPGVDIAANGNVIIGWEDDGSGIYDFESAWSVFNANGVLLTPQTVITSYVALATITNTYLSYFRSDGSATPAYTGFGPKIKANRFGNGIGHGSSTDALGGEVPELAALNADDGSPTAGFSAVQILNNDGTPIRILTGGSDADYQTTGSARIGDWDYLANGNIVIVNDSRQNDDLVTKFGGAAPGNHGTYRVVTSAGAVVKGYSLLSSTNTSIYNIWHGVGVTANGFAVRFSYGSGAKVRLFDNAGNPTSSDIDLATLAGHPEAGAGGRGDGTGFHGNGKDAYVHVATAAGGVVWVTVLNADGTLRWSRSVADTNETFVANRVDGAIAPDGRVIAVWDSALPNVGGGTSRLIQARLFGANGQPLGGRFVVSEWENPANPATIYTSEIPRVAWRNDTIAIVWLSHNAPTVVNDPTSPGAAEVIAARLFSPAVVPLTNTFYVNTNYYNNAGGESPGVDIAANGNVIIGWEDDGSGIYDFESAWSIFNANGVLLTPQTVITSYVALATITNTYLSYFRSDGSATPAYTGFGPKIKANRFGNGIGHGSSTDALGGEVPELAALNADDGSPTASFSAVQILNNDGTPIRILTGGSDADYQTTGSARIGDWDYLANGNIVIVNDSRQNDDLVTKFGGATPGNHGTYRVVTSAGAVVKGYSLLSSANTSIYNIWHGVGVTANGFAVRFSYGSGAKVRLFDNAGNPTSNDIDLATLAGHPEAGAGGRGDGTGFHGNGKDAYVHVATAAGGVVWVTVLNADGTLRWSRSAADTNETFVANRVDGAIAPDGRVIVVWDSALPGAGSSIPNRLIQARLFGANGQPLGGRFVVSEWENPANPATIYTSEIPRVAWRNDTIAIVWLSHNAPTVVNDPTSPGAAEVIAAALFKVYDIAPPSLITKVVETGGDNEPTDTITAKWTGQTFPVSIANEPILGAVIGSNYTVGSFGNGAPAFVDRNHIYTNATPTVLIPSYLVGREYIMSGNDNRDNPSLTMDVTVSQPVDVYLLIDNRNGDGSNANPPTFTGTNMQWVLDQSWAAVKSGINRTGNSNVPDEVGIDEGSDGTINNWYSIYAKSFPAGTFQLKQADNNGQNMYGAVVTLQQRMTIGQVGANIVITYPAGFRLQRATSVNGPWTDVSGTSPVTEPISPGQRYYRSVSP